MPLIHPAEYSEIFEKFSGLHMGFVQLSGNVGDKLIHMATMQLFQYFDIDVHFISNEQIESNSLPPDIDEIVVSGGGNLGTYYPNCYNGRRAVLKLGLPVSVLPQSFASDDENLSDFKQIYVRDKRSKAIWPSAIVMPDLALSLGSINNLTYDKHDTGVFLRTDSESIFQDKSCSLVDPAKIFTRAEDYLEFASSFNNIVTDRLHFAIAGMIAGKNVSLLPNKNHKNRNIFETWLADLGCKWMDSPYDVHYDIENTNTNHWHNFLPDRGNAVYWHSRFRKVHTKSLVINQYRSRFFPQIPGKSLDVNRKGQGIFAFCDGKNTIKEIIEKSASEKNESVHITGPEVIKFVDRFYRFGIVGNSSDFYVKVHILPLLVRNDKVIKRAHLFLPGQKVRELWYSLERQHYDHVSDRSECFLLVALLMGMQMSLDVKFSNAVADPFFIDHLYELQRLLLTKQPQLSEVDIDCPEKTVRQDITTGGLGICATGGETLKLIEMIKAGIAQNQLIAKILLVSGYHVPLSDFGFFRTLYLKANSTNQNTSVSIIPVHTNCLSVLGKAFSEGLSHLVASSLLHACNGNSKSGYLIDSSLGGNSQTGNELSLTSTKNFRVSRITDCEVDRKLMS